MQPSSPLRQHQAISPIVVVLAALCALLATLFWSEDLLAQAPRNFRTPRIDLPNLESSEAEAESLPESTAPLRRVIVDTDPGVDDAAALIWLFSQRRYDVEILGVVTIAGNSSITNTTNNAQLILDWLKLEEEIPLIQGAAGPLTQTLSLAQSLIHGPDGLWGLWFTSAPEPMLEPLSATEFYCTNLEPGVLVLTLGPLTNIALAINECPGQWTGVEIVSLGGGKFKSNQTPVTEYNFWQDPEAAALVLSNTVASGLGITMQIVLADAFTQFEIGPSDTRQMDHRGVPAIQNLLPALEIYIFGLSQGGESVALPDPAAAIYALDNRLGTANSALVEVLTGVPEVARGQTVIGLIPIEKIVMIAGDAVLGELASQLNSGELTLDEFAMAVGNILFSQPDNAMVVTDIDARRMHYIFLRGLRNHNISPTSGSGEETQQSDFENQMFIPFVLD